MTRRVVTLGHVDRAEIREGVLCVDGWAGSPDGRVDGIAVSCGRRSLTDFDLAIGLPSPDVAAVYPNLVDASNLRFSLREQVGDDAVEAVGDRLLSLTPMVGGRVGYSLLRVPEPSMPLPPPDLATCVGGAFVDIAFRYLGLFVDLAGLRPSDRVLDVGCGVGRMAYALAYYLDPEGRYEGFDLAPRLVEWARENIAARRPNFAFRLVDLRNPHYNPGGAIPPLELVFPYADESFDFAIVTSVFTHLPAPEIRHYLDEIQRVLRPGGRCVVSCFLLNAESLAHIAAGTASPVFRHAAREGMVANPADPLGAIGYPEAHLREWIETAGFSILDVHYGRWCPRERSVVAGPDVMILQKDGRAPADRFRARALAAERRLVALWDRLEARDRELAALRSDLRDALAGQAQAQADLASARRSRLWQVGQFVWRARARLRRHGGR